MTNLATYFDQLLFVALPYVAFFVFFLVSITRYHWRGFTYSSLSSQFLENRQHFWGLVPFHYGIIVVLTGHVVAWLIPRQVLWWNDRPLRLYILEISALACGLLTLIGLVSLMLRRLTVSKIRVVTSKLDWVVLLLLLAQVVSGVGTAVLYPWGSSWYAAMAAPYLWSILKLNPDLTYIAAMPPLVKFHIVGAFALILVFPFSRLVHILVIPNPYLWRKPQVARWYRAPGEAAGEPV
ncbi:MAG: respiratory nitrate reductase subunit gamma [Bryobacterales bacterium]|nr:respiratory nitrate reductase subunit gamma [Bryobacterales bacterium]